MEEQLNQSAQPIQIDESMPEDLKAAINYLNENGIGLNDKIIDVEDDSEEENDNENLNIEDIEVEIDPEIINNLMEDDIEEDDEEELEDIF